ncbi:MAG: hypothetical protein MJZ20_00400 [Bacteroidaceae bacterium]|nr:hypothetical protein [Bacteroidaceae bacterium]
MFFDSFIFSIAAGFIQTTKQSGQSIQQWIQSPEGKKQLQEISSKYGPDVLNDTLRKLGIK